MVMRMEWSYKIAFHFYLVIIAIRGLVQCVRHILELEKKIATSGYTQARVLLLQKALPFCDIFVSRRCYSA